MRKQISARRPSRERGANSDSNSLWSPSATVPRSLTSILEHLHLLHVASLVLCQDVIRHTKLLSRIEKVRHQHRGYTAAYMHESGAISQKSLEIVISARARFRFGSFLGCSVPATRIGYITATAPCGMTLNCLDAPPDLPNARHSCLMYMQCVFSFTRMQMVSCTSCLQVGATGRATYFCCRKMATCLNASRHLVTLSHLPLLPLLSLLSMGLQAGRDRDPIDRESPVCRTNHLHRCEKEDSM